MGYYEVNVHAMGRRTGKSTTVVNRLRGDSALMAIVPFQQYKDYILDNLAKDDKDRAYLSVCIVTMRDFLDHPRAAVARIARWEHERPTSRVIRKVLIDEGLTRDYNRIYNVMHACGDMGLKVEVWGTDPFLQ